MILPSMALYLACFPVLPGRFAPAPVEQVLKVHGLPLFAAESARLQAIRENGAKRTKRLVTTDFRVIYSPQDARRLSDAVLIYCTEPDPRRRAWGDLALAASSVGARMSRASPLLTSAVHLRLNGPLRVTMAHVDGRGRVRHTETHAIVELTHTGPPRT